MILNIVTIVKLMKNSVSEKMGRDRTNSITTPEMIRLIRTFSNKYLEGKIFLVMKFKVR